MKNYEELFVKVILIQEDIVKTSNDILVEWDWDDVQDGNIFG